MLLNCHTYYSLCYGTFAPQALVDQVRQRGYSSFALTDINNTSACLDALRHAQEDSFHLVIGIDFRNGAQQQYIALARTNAGFAALNAHLSQHLHQSLPFAPQAPPLPGVYIIYPLAAYLALEDKTLRAHEYVGLSPRDVANMAIRPLACPPDRLVALQTVTFANRQMHNAHRLLRAIDGNTLLSKLPPSEQGSPEHILPQAAELEAAYGAAPQLLARAHTLLAGCKVSFAYGKFANKNRKNYTPTANGDMQTLRALCMAGLAYRYKNARPSPAVVERMEKELRIIKQMKFASYFLLNWHIVQYAQSKDYFYVGRGSGANSLVAYLLRITDVDPLELDLYFERFINPHRANPPDFDLDFSWTDRDDITRQIFEDFGYDRVALLGAYSTFQHDAIIRQLGKVFGLPSAEIDRLQERRSPALPDKLSRLVMKYAEILQGFPSHLSIHSSGILISEEPIHSYSATFLPPKGFPTVQFSMIEAEDIGLYKFDILSQRGLGKIKDCLDMIALGGTQLDIHDLGLFKTDETVKSMLRYGRTIGCFYVESPAMRMLFTKLQADDYIRLVAASSIIRPGVARSGMMQQYIERFRKPEARERARNALPEFYDILAETYGVMVYQEDVIRVAHLFAGLDLAEADYLRRGMSWKFKQRSEFAVVRQRFFDNCKERRYPDTLVQAIWEQIESFANFAFSKGHSASYAVESFQAMYLKAHWPLQYMVATLNNGGGFYRPELYLHEARLHGATVRPPCVNSSIDICRLQGTTIWLGLSMLKNIEQNSLELLVAARTSHGPFAHLADFIARVPIGIEQIRVLIRIGAFGFTGLGKKELIWQAYMLFNPAKMQPEQELFAAPPKAWSLPQLVENPIDDAYDEIELLGFPLCNPFTLLKAQPPAHLSAAIIRQSIGKRVSAVGYLVTRKPTKTAKGEYMAFGTFIDRAGDWIDTVHFPQALATHPFTGPGCYWLQGKVQSEFDFAYINITSMHHLAIHNLDDAT